MPLTIGCVVGARPNFIKIAPIMRQLRSHPETFRPVLVHTGQHYDQNLSNVFFEQLHIPRPDYQLEVGMASPAIQTATIIERFDALCEQLEFDRVLVVGDVTSTLSCALVAAKRLIPVDHVEAGLRSFDRRMPEEINRIVTDSLADLLFVSEPSGIDNLRREGHADRQIRFVGNVMIDSLHIFLEDALALDMPRRFRLKSKEFGVVTLHRPSNVDEPQRIAELLELLAITSKQVPLIFPVHPRTRSRLTPHTKHEGVVFTEPLGYLEFLGLMNSAVAVITDSGGIQEETTALGIPCITLRSNTERPITVHVGTNTLLGDDVATLPAVIDDVVGGRYKLGRTPELWDGHASERIAKILSCEVLPSARCGRGGGGHTTDPIWGV